MNNYVLGSEPLNGRSGHDAGRELLKKLYSENIGGEIPDILIAERGKPYFSTGNVYFSISHTKRHVFCVLADREVGIDAEELDRAVKPALAAKILSAGELTQYQVAKDTNRALLTFWVLKEAAAKASGEGLRGYPNHTNFSLNDPRVTELDSCLVAVIAKEETHAL
jgi:phosphopantetheine--protein transferase-like protein